MLYVQFVNLWLQQELDDGRLQESPSWRAISLVASGKRLVAGRAVYPTTARSRPLIGPTLNNYATLSKVTLSEATLKRANPVVTTRKMMERRGLRMNIFLLLAKT